ncbi:hypothetical protein L916_12946 [Phytophthora nicotianae]|uniref:START domain-containing protein n=1 Tax=Phytophthora nicotianae TaxID=4792 RepID=W2INA1_PHYNI|nr:hypothetical protein L916_12946 [Phytophthora nicotianae]
MECQLDTADAQDPVSEKSSRLPTEESVALVVPDTRNAKLRKRKTRRIIKCRVYPSGSKAECDELRRQEADLRQEMLRLQQLNKAEKEKHDACQSHAYWIWKDLASRLRVERDDAEAQQQQLRSTMLNQAMYIDTLLKIMDEQSSNSTWFVDNNEPPESFNRPIQELEARFLQTDAVFQAASSSLSRDISRATDQGGTDGGVHFFYPQLRLVLPSPLHETSNTLWQLGQCLFSDKPDYVEYYSIKDPEHTFIATFVDTNVLETGDILRSSQLYIARRFVQDNRIVIIWRLIIKGNDSFQGIKSDETGWCRFLPSEDAMEPGTTIEVCIHRVPVHSTAPVSCELDVSLFFSLVHETSQDILTKVVSTMENVLLQKALAHIM